MAEKKNFEPKIIGFCCNWCSYAGADLAGVSRLQYPPNLRMIRVMCSGSVNPEHILESFRQGADGVFIGGCHPGDCHYISGNYKTLRRVSLLKKLLPQFGLEPERLRLDWISAAEGQRFAQAVTEFTEEIKKLGPARAAGRSAKPKLIEIESLGENAVPTTSSG